MKNSVKVLYHTYTFYFLLSLACLSLFHNTYQTILISIKDRLNNGRR